MGRVTQIKVLTTKSGILAVRNWKGSLGQLVAPLVIMLLMLMFQLLINTIAAGQEKEITSISSIGVVPKCTHGEHRNCTTIIFAPSTDETVNLMKIVASSNKLNYGEDVKPLMFDKTLQNQDYLKLQYYYYENQNGTTLGVFFSGVYTENAQFPLAGYVINYNKSAANSYNLELKRTLDEAIIQTYQNDPGYSLNTGWQTFPLAPNRYTDSIDIVSLAGGQWFYVPPMVTFFILLAEVVTEKEQRLRLGMRMMGLNDGVYWFVWFLTGLFFVTASTLILILSGMACQFDFFINANFFALFLVFFLFGVSMYMVSFFISTLVNTVATAQTIGYIVILVGFVFQAILTSFYGILFRLMYAQTIPWIVALKWLLFLYPPFNFACAFFDISTFAGTTMNFTSFTMEKGPGFSFSDLFKENSMDTPDFGELSVPACYVSLLWLLFDIFFFGVLTWYFDNVLPGEHGSPRPLYFFVTAEYWGFNTRRNDAYMAGNVEISHSNTDSDVEREGTQVHERGNDPSIAVKIIGLQKTYKTGLASYFSDTGRVKALQGLNLLIENGELFCLLGHNGAGKTTTINILTGLFASSAGCASIYGLDVDTQIAEIRKQTGVCPQHDILWNELTAREHLRLFAKLKDVNSNEIEEAIQNKLEQMGLEKVGDNKAGTFSGGMKRRLSVAISAIGDPKIIFMDEPTTGMDPVNRRAVWQMIQDLKRDRVILLTTHSMEEADVLGDRIGIMAYGKLRCLGNSLHLKNKYGAGYRIDLVSPNPTDLRNHIAQNFPFAQETSVDGNSLAYNIRREHQGNGLIEILRYFEDKNLSGSLVQEWNVAHSSLEEVFLEVSRINQFTYNANATDPDEMVDEDHDQKPATGDPYAEELNTSIQINDSKNGEKKKSPPTHPYRALVRKNLTLQKRQCATNCCQIITPLFVLFIMLVLQLIIKNKLDGDTVQVENITGPPYGLNSDFNYTLNFPDFLVGNQFNDLNDLATSRQQSFLMTLWKSLSKKGSFEVVLSYLGVPPPVLSPDQACALSCQIISFPFRFVKALQNRYYLFGTISGQCLEFGVYTTTSQEEVGSLDQAGDGTGLLGKIRQKGCSLQDTSIVQVPYFTYSNSSKEIASTLLQEQKQLNSVPLDQVQAPPALYLLPDASFNFIEVTEKTFNFTFAVNDNIQIEYHRANFVTRTNNNISTVWGLGSDNLIPGMGRVMVMDWLNFGYLAYVNDSSLPTAQQENQYFSRWIQQMPYVEYTSLLDIVEYMGMTLYPIALCLQLPVYIYILVLEKAEKLREMMKCMGMRRLPYLVTNILFFFVLYLLSVLLFWVIGFAIGQRFFTQTGFTTLFLFFLGWGFSIIALAYFFASFLSSKRAASVVGYSLALIGTLVAEVICNYMFAVDGTSSLGDVMPWPFLLYPQFPFTRGLYLMSMACTQISCYGEIGTYDGELVGILIALYVDAVFYMLFALYLDEVLPREFGVPKEPLFFARPLINWFKSKFHEHDEGERDPLILTSSNSAYPLFSEDKDCLNERRRVEEGTYPQDCPLVLKNLRKEYSGSPKKIAVVNFSLAVERGECFGLLGENGAGKTTTISMLTGIYPPSSGSAFVGGFNIVDDIDRAHLVMGVCPQFNVLWDDLTVEEHILFYARLKGIPVSEEPKHLETSLVQVGLYHVRERLSKNLSGGMKRRLSVAISLVGNSAVVFLDEPTTGLDPSSRRQLWKILQRAKKGRAIVLTTHAMDEAELLCTRIGILALGRLRCIGTSTHLRNSVSAGYRLQINYSPEKESNAQDFVKQVFPGSEITSQFRGTCKFFLNPSSRGSSIADGFARLIESAGDSGITDFAFSQFGLEDVFQKIVDRSHTEEDNAGERV
eukprot:TRINITY_DN4957_c0_g2_i1.p1 TRINITY_DN4957_c0_g2~~TRINITY_DN4957_c0_g2_i1.p1  ORF type:complete len:1851 (-),score=296.09 TRINITY_DN4957_c0_g2_i1:13-5565(-)